MAWAKVLEPFSYPDVERVVMELAGELRFPPSLAEIIARFREVDGSGVGAVWDGVYQSIAHGNDDLYRALSSGQKGIAQVVVKQLGGWEYLHLLPADKLPVVKSRFLDLYGEMERGADMREPDGLVALP